MLLSSVIITLREVLEASLLFSILIALSRQSDLSQYWVKWAIAMGIIGASIYAFNIAVVTDWFEGVGQEVVNALIQLAIYIFLVAYMLMQYSLNHSTGSNSIDKKSWQKSRLIIMFMMIIVTSLAMTREGSEILLYFFSVTHNSSHLLAVSIGMGIGASIGISVGFLLYYFLVNISRLWAVNIAMSFLMLIAAALVSQAILLLIQADWLTAQLPIWDTSEWISEKSVSGQLLYALLGYESTPTAIQLSFYLFSFLIPLLFLFIIKKYQSNKVLANETN